MNVAAFHTRSMVFMTDYNARSVGKNVVRGWRSREKEKRHREREGGGGADVDGERGGMRGEMGDKGKEKRERWRWREG